MYIHEHKNWPQFTWDSEKITHLLAEVRHVQGRLIGALESIGFRYRDEMILQTLTLDVVKSSEIEGEILDPEAVCSSVARHLGVETVGLSVPDRNVDGIVQILLDATQKFDQAITRERLFMWHRWLFPSAKKIRIGAWRTNRVQVVSGPMGRETIHFEGPVPERVDKEMACFLQWLNDNNSIDLMLKAAIAHLWFETIHPFDDGNGRIGRAIVDLLLARSEKSSHRCYSLSAEIMAERKGYYAILKQTTSNGLDITPWIEWFLRCLEKAIEKAFTTLKKTLHKANVWKALAKLSLNKRQQKLIDRLLDGFIGKLTSSKWAQIAKCSQDTAYRDILELIEYGILVKNDEGGRSTSYSLAKKYQ